MFQLSKLLPLQVLSLRVVVLLLIWGALRGSPWAGIVVLACLGLFATLLVAEGLWRWLEQTCQRQTAARVLQQDRAAGADAPAEVVVLGGGRHVAPCPAGMSEWIDADRFFGGLEACQQLRRQVQRPRLIFTGGWWPTHPNLPPAAAWRS